jgi:hypothetical protein
MSRTRPAFLLLEAALGIAVFSLFLVAVSLVMLNGQEATIRSGDRIRGVYGAEMAIEAARDIREGGFSSVTAGQHGVSLNASGRWQFQGTSTSDSGGTLTALTVTSVSSGWKQLVARAAWTRGTVGSGSATINAEMTDWRTPRWPGDWSSVTLVGSATGAGSPQYAAVAVGGNTAYVAGTASPGLSLYDISTLSAPARIDASFTLGSGVGANGVAVRGKRLYVLTTDPSAELRAYDITAPASLSTANLVTSVNLTGSSLATSLALDGDLLVVGMKASGSRQLYTFSVANSGAIVPLGSAAGSADVNAIALSGSSAYLATSNSTAELGIVFLHDWLHPAYASGEGFNLTGGLKGLSVALSGTAALLGQEKGSSNVVFFDLGDGDVPDPPPSPLYHQGSGSIVAAQIDAAACYAFLGAQSGTKALQIINLRDPSLPEIATYQTGSPLQQARGLFYDIVRDRLFFLTTSSLLILAPGSATGPCS